MTLHAITRSEWAAALRSGKYRQARERLHQDGSFCCLGVALELCGVSTDEMAAWGFPDTILGHEEADRVFPINYDERDLLAKINDDGKSFSEIADVIEQLPGGEGVG